MFIVWLQFSYFCGFCFANRVTLVAHMQFSSNNVTLCAFQRVWPTVFPLWDHRLLCTAFTSSFNLLLFLSLSLLFLKNCFVNCIYFLNYWWSPHFFNVCTVLVFSAADKTKFQLLQILLPSGMTLSSGCLFTALDVWAKIWQ